MRILALGGIAAVLVAIGFCPSVAEAARYIQISEPFVNVYEVLDPRSDVLKMIKKGDRLEVVSVGTLWYEVKIGDKTGWVERRAGRLTEGKGGAFPIGSIALTFLLAGCAAYGTIFCINKKQAA